MYTEEHARRAQYRHERRSPEERLTLLRALLCSAAYDTSPSFEGVDEKTGEPYKGPTVAEWMCDSVGYFLYGKLSIERIIDLVKAGYYRASEHEWMSRKYWESRKEE